MQYIVKKNMGNLGWVQIVLAIASFAIPLIQQGWSAHSAVEQAKKDANLQRSLDEQEKLQLAQRLNIKFPSVSVGDFLASINLAETMSTPTDKGNGDQPQTENYWIYAALFVGVLVLTQKRD